MTALGGRSGEVIEQLLAEPTLGSAFLRAAELRSERVALREFGTPERSLSLGEWAERSSAVAGGLRSLGLAPGDRVALLLTTRLDFHIVDMGVVLAGAVPFSLYATSPVAQLAQCVENAMPRVLITEAALADNARDLQAACPVIEHLIVLEDARTQELSLAELADRCPPGFDPRAVIADVRAEDLCSLLYTSGTSGPPKGVCFVHAALMATMRAIDERFPVSPEGATVSYLPMAHIAERLFSHYAAFVFGYTVTALGEMPRLLDALLGVRPTRFFGVPRTWEKLLAAVDAQLEPRFGAERAAAIRAALARAVARVQADQNARLAPRELDSTCEQDDDLLAALPDLVGLNRVEWACIAGAPADRATVEAFHAMGVAINELYGMSETIMTTMSPPDQIRIGWAGTPMPGTRVKLAADGEILINGPTVTPGYYRDPERTREAIDAEGWMHSGDIGELDERGYVRIVDRKKALIINSSGKNMSPAAIEQAIRGGCPLLGQVVVFGDRRPYNVALIVLDPEGLPALCRDRAVTPAPLAELSRHPEVLAAVQAAIAAGNARLSRVEQIKRHAVLDHVWLPADFALTATAKLKRAQIADRYAELIEGLYR
jgi:long-chain acyl-CoA synthetase